MGRTEHTNGSVTWVGTLGSDPMLQVLTGGAENMVGHIIVGDERYMIEPLGDGMHALYRTDISKLPRSTEPDFGMGKGRESGDPGTRLTTEEPEDVGSNAGRRSLSVDSMGQPFVGHEHNLLADLLPVVEGQRLTDPEIDVLFLYTDYARDGAGGVNDMMDMINQMVYELNGTIFDNTDIDVTIRNVHAFESEYEDDDVNPIDGNALLSDLFDDQLDDLDDTRELWGGDLVIMIVENTLSVNSASYNGYTYRIGADDSRAFALVKRENALSTYTFAHEIGHLMGARHQYAVDDSTSPVVYGHGFEVDPPAPLGKYCTIMCLFNERIEYYSSETYSYGGEDLGDEALAEVSYLWESEAPTVSAFRSSLVLSVENVDVSGPDILEWHDYELLDGSADLFDPEGYVKHCETDCSYQWYDREPEGTWYEYGTATQDIYVLWQWTESHEFKLEVTHEGGSETSDPKIISYCASPPCTGFAKMGDNERSTDTEIPAEYALHAAYPNPFNPSTTIGFDIPEVSRVTIRVYDALGRLVEEIANQEFPAGTHHVSWDAQGYASGVYLVKMEDGNHVESQYVTLMK